MAIQRLSVHSENKSILIKSIFRLCGYIPYTSIPTMSDSPSTLPSVCKPSGTAAATRGWRFGLFRCPGCLPRWRFARAAFAAACCAVNACRRRWWWWAISTLAAPANPLTLALLAELRAAGLRPGVISRGYGNARAPGAGGACPRDDRLKSATNPFAVRQAGFAVAIGRRRSEAGRALLAAHPEVNVILADDGCNTTRWRATSSWRWWTAGAVSGRLLPAGPLARVRQPAGAVDAGGGEWRRGAARLAGASALLSYAFAARRALPAGQPAGRCAPADLPGRVVALVEHWPPATLFSTSLRQQG